MRMATRRDLIIIAGLILCAVVGLILTATGSSLAGERALVVSGGKERVFALPSDGAWAIEGHGGALQMEIADGRVRVAASDCPDHLCVKAGWASHRGEVIACLPLGIVITVEGGEGYDAIAH